MTIRINCPSCEAAYTVEDGLRGKRIRCKKCEEIFAVQPSRGGNDREEEDRPSRRVAAPPVPKSPVRRARDEDDDERPVRKPVRDRDEDETPERRPASRVRASKDDEPPRRRPIRDRDDERPIRKKKIEKEGMSVGLLVGIGGGALLLIGLLVGGVVFALSSSDKPSNPQVAAPPVVGNPVPVAANPQNPPVKQEEPKALPGDLSLEALERVKASTVYLRVELPSGGVAQGTGFFAVEPGLIITNAHVLGMLTPDSLTPRSVIVKVHHGERKERTLKGLIVGVDRANDLAVLRTDAVPSTLPPPLQIEPASKLTETQKVWVFGFPLGVQLGKNITVSPSSVTSLRKDANGALSQLQVAGGMQPGNSGGPVTDSRGLVVGVSVAIIPGTQIAFAIPGEFVTRVLAGGISEQQFGMAYSAGGGRTAIPVRLKALDPLLCLRKVEVDLWTGTAGEDLPASDKEPPPRLGDGTRTRIPATVTPRGYAVDVHLPPLPAGQFYWSQPVTVDAGGVTKWAAAKAIPFDPALVIDRKAVLLQFKAPTGPIERTLHIKSDKSLNVFGLDEPLTFSEKMETYALESSAPDAKMPGTRARLHMERPRFTREGGGKEGFAPDVLIDLMAGLSPSYLVTPNNSVTNFGRPLLNEVPKAARETIGEMFDVICNTYEVTSIPLPNKLVQPGETWTASVNMLLVSPPRKEMRTIRGRTITRNIPARKEFRTLNLTCTYEGTRAVDGIHQGYVRLTGVVNGTGAQAKDVFGKVSGHVHVNLDSGMLSQVKTTISTELEAEGGARLLVTNENIVDRTEGNSQGIKPPEVVPIPDGWKRYVSEDGSFRVMLPDTAAPVKDQTATVLPRKGVPLSLVYTKVVGTAKGPPVYVASSVAVNRVDFIGKATTNGRIDWFRDLELERGKYKATGEKAIRQGRVPGKEFRVERPTGISRYRVYMHEAKYYLAVVTGTKEQIESEAATIFLDSYTIPASITGPIAKKAKGKDVPKGKDAEKPKEKEKAK